MSVCAAPTCSHQSFDGSSYYVDRCRCRTHVLSTLFVFVCAYWNPTHIALWFLLLLFLFKFALFFVYPMLPVSLDCPFLMPPEGRIKLA